MTLLTICSSIGVPSFLVSKIDFCADEARVIGCRYDLLDLELSAHLWVYYSDVVRVLHEWSGNRFQFPDAPGSRMTFIFLLGTCFRSEYPCDESFIFVTPACDKK